MPAPSPSRERLHARVPSLRFAVPAEPGRAAGSLPAVCQRSQPGPTAAAPGGTQRERRPSRKTSVNSPFPPGVPSSRTVPFTPLLL